MATNLPALLLCLGSVARVGVLFFLLACATGCRYESFRGEAGSGYHVGIDVGPAAVLLVGLSAALLGYFAWRRRTR